MTGVSVVAPTSGAVSHTFVRQHAACVSNRHSFITLASESAAWPEATNLDLGRMERNLQMGAARRASRSLVEALAGASVVHAHFGQVGWLIAPSVRKLGLPLVVTAHGSEMVADASALTRDGLGSVLWAAARNRFVADPQVTWIAVSRSLADRMVVGGVDAAHIHVVPNPLPSALPTPVASANRRGVVFVGRLVEVKGAQLLVPIARQLHALGNSEEITVIGDGPLREEIQVAVDTEGLRVRLLGSLEHAATLQHMARARAVVVPSVVDGAGRAEALGMASVEAQAVGTPVVVADVGGLPETLVDGETGVVVAAGDVNEFARQLDGILRDPFRAEMWGGAGRQQALARFGPDAIVERLDQVYDSFT